MRTRTLLHAAIVLLAVTACDRASDALDPAASVVPVVLNLTPANATTGVDPTNPIVVTFNRPMMVRMEALVVLHSGSITGPVVAGTASWSADRTVLTFTPSAPLKPATTYVLHLSPSLRAVNGRRIDLAACARLGGLTVTPGMIGLGPRGGMMNGSWGPGMMGEGWRAADGTFGMIFTFTTA